MGISALGLVQVACECPQTDGSTDVQAALDCLRVAITLFDSDERLTYCNKHYNHLFRSLPPSESLLGARYEYLIRLELAGGEIAEAEALDAENFYRAPAAAADRGRFSAVRHCPDGWTHHRIEDAPDARRRLDHPVE